MDSHPIARSESPLDLAQTLLAGTAAAPAKIAKYLDPDHIFRRKPSGTRKDRSILFRVLCRDSSKTFPLNPECIETTMNELDRFVAESNINRFKEILRQDITVERRNVILKLLEDAEESLRQINSFSSAPHQKP